MPRKRGLIFLEAQISAFFEVAIVGAGPYGLSLAACLNQLGMSVRVFGRPMQTWLEHMPRGMLLKSDGFATNLHDSDGAFTLAAFCAENGLPYRHEGLPVRLDVFCAYGQAFQRRFVSNLEPVDVVSVARVESGFLLTLADGAVARARRVVMAVGVGAFQNVPAPFDQLPANCITHSFDVADPGRFAGQRIAVIGGGASAIDVAVLAGEAGAAVELVCRRPQLIFGGKLQEKRSLWQQISNPGSGLGPGWRSRLACDAPLLFHAMPEAFRLEVVARHLGPLAGWPMRERMNDAVTVRPNRKIAGARFVEGKVELKLAAPAGAEETFRVDHVIAGTGYKVETQRLTMLAPALRDEIRNSKRGAPALSSYFESSAPGLYFIGLAAAPSFGPLLRFVFGARFAARRVTAHLRRRAVVRAPAPLLSDRPA